MDSKIDPVLLGLWFTVGFVFGVIATTFLHEVMGA